MEAALSSSESIEQNIPPLRSLTFSPPPSSSLSSQEKADEENLQSIEEKGREHPDHSSDHSSDPLKTSSLNGDRDDEDIQQDQQKETPKDSDQESDQIHHSRKRPRSPPAQEENKGEGEEDPAFQGLKLHRP